MPEITDLVKEVKTVHHQMSSRVDDIDAEQKKLREEFVSKTANLDGFSEWKVMFEKQNSRVNELVDQIEALKLQAEQSRIEAMRPPLFGSKSQTAKRSDAHKAFMKAMKNRGDTGILTLEEKSLIMKDYMPAERKALYAADATTGGFFASTDFMDELQQYKILISKMRTICRVQQTSGERVQMPSLQGDTTAYWAAEQASFTDSSDPTIGMITIPVHELRGLLKVSQQNLEDSLFNLEDLIKQRLMLKFAQAEGKAFLVGNGVGQPRGILSYPTAATTGFSGGSAGKNVNIQQIPYVLSGAATGKINADDVLNVKMDLKADYDVGATYCFTRGTLNTIRLLKDSQNRPLWQPFAGANLPSLIYDAPYVEMPDMAEIGSAAFPIIVGDFSNYMIVDRITMNIQQLNELFAVSGLVGFIARMRVGGDVLLPESFRLLKCN